MAKDTQAIQNEWEEMLPRSPKEHFFQLDQRLQEEFEIAESYLQQLIIKAKQNPQVTQLEILQQIAKAQGCVLPYDPGEENKQANELLCFHLKRKQLSRFKKDGTESPVQHTFLVMQTQEDPYYKLLARARRKTFSYTESEKVSEGIYGYGGFGVVGALVDKQGTVFAGKIEGIEKNKERSPEEIKSEIEIMQTLGEIKGVYQSNTQTKEWLGKKNISAKLHYVVKQYGRNLQQVLSSVQLDQEKVLEYFLAMAKAVKKMHEKNIIHCDLKPENFAVDNIGPPLEIAAIDFGFAIQLNEGEETRVLKYARGTEGYISPEVSKTQQYSKDSDIYALQKAFQAFLDVCPAANKNAQYNNLISKMSQHSAQDRYNIDEVIKALEVIKMNNKIKNKDEVIKEPQVIKRNNKIKNKIAHRIKSFFTKITKLFSAFLKLFQLQKRDQKRISLVGKQSRPDHTIHLAQGSKESNNQSKNSHTTGLCSEVELGEIETVLQCIKTNNLEKLKYFFDHTKIDKSTILDQRQRVDIDPEHENTYDLNLLQYINFCQLKLQRKNQGNQDQSVGREINNYYDMYNFITTELKACKTKTILNANAPLPYKEIKHSGGDIKIIPQHNSAQLGAPKRRNSI